MTDIVYVLWSRSRYHNKELRYSVRSVWKHGKNLGSLWIVGMPIKFLQPHFSIPYSPSYSCTDVNVFGAILRACENPDVSDPFLLFNDDYFMLREFDADAIPAWYSEPWFKNRRNWGLYQRTLKILRARGVEHPRFFDVHMPILIHKDSMRKSCPKNWESRRFLSKTMYANQCPELNPIETSDCKLRVPGDLEAAKAGLMFSTSHYVHPSVWKYLEETFPAPGPFEISCL